MQLKIILRLTKKVKLFNDVLATFLCVHRDGILAVYGRIRELSDLIKNILICVPKKNEGLTGLERHEDE